MFHTDRLPIAQRLQADAAELRDGLHASAAAKGAADLEQLQWIRRCDAAELWREGGARSIAEWLAAELGLSRWKAARMVNTAHALRRLPRTSAYLANGSLSLDKVLELTRFATPATEKKLLSWARRVSPAAIRRRADKAADVKINDVKGAVESRSLTWWMKPDGLSLRLEGDLPLATGAAFCAAIDRVAGTLPDLPPEEGQPVRDPRFTIEQRRADALALMASALIANDQEPDLATVVLSTSLDAPAVETDAVGGILKGLGLSLGGALAAETAERIACDCRLSVARLDGLGDTVGIGRVSRTIPRWLRRQLMTRDGHQCQFPGCDAVRFLHGHHIWHWALGGPTNLDNLIALCHAHHTLVHEFGWGVKRDRFGEVTWFRPSGRIFSPGPAPPEAPSEGSAQPKTTEVPRLIEARGFSRLFALSDCL